MSFDISLFGWAIFAGLFAGIVVIFVTFLIEKYGGIVGGILGVTPTTIVPASISLAITTLPAQPEAIVLSMYSFPAGMVLCAIFLLTWNFSVSFYNSNFPNINEKLILLYIIITTLSIWFVGAILEYFFFSFIRDEHLLHVPFRIIGITAIIIQFILGIGNALYKKVAAPKGRKRITVYAYCTRGIFAGCIIFLSIMISNLSEIAAGIMSAFPAIFLTTMFFLYIDQGRDVQAGAVGPMMLGSLSVSAYAMFFAEIVTFVFRRFYSSYSSLLRAIFLTFLSSLLAYVFAVILFTIPVFLFFRWLHSVPPVSTVLENNEETPLISSNDDGDDNSHSRRRSLEGNV